MIASEMYSRARGGVIVLKKSHAGSFPEDQSKSWERADAVSPPRGLTAANPDSPRVLTVSCWGDRRKKEGLKIKYT